MPNLNIDLSIENLAVCIKKLTESELNKLGELLFLKEELLKRKAEIETGKVQPLSEEEVFDV